MKVGTIMQLTSFDGKPDPQTYQEELSLADKAEDYGFDSLWSLDHHFTGYVMSPDPCQLLSYMAGRTKKIQLGTAVIVLPWHDPVEIAEKIALLDLVSGGRTIFGFGRGAATVEYAGFRIPMDESRERFVECADIIRRGLTQDSFSYDGTYYQIPDIQVRPRPISNPETRFYASSVSPESADIMAKMGFGVLIIAQRSWEDTATDYQRYYETALANNITPRPPIGLFNVLVSDDAKEAEDLAQHYMGTLFDSIENHYGFSSGKLKNVKGYEFYGKMAKTYAKLNADDAGQDQGDRVLPQPARGRHAGPGARKNPLYSPDGRARPHGRHLRLRRPAGAETEPQLPTLCREGPAGASDRPGLPTAQGAGRAGRGQRLASA